MARSKFRKKKEHKLKVKLKKEEEKLAEMVDEVDSLLNFDIAQMEK